MRKLEPIRKSFMTMSEQDVLRFASSRVTFSRMDVTFISVVTPLFTMYGTFAVNDTIVTTSKHLLH